MMKSYVTTTVSLPRDLRTRLDESNKARGHAENLSDEITRRLELSFALDSVSFHFAATGGCIVEPTGDTGRPSIMETLARNTDEVARQDPEVFCVIGKDVCNRTYLFTEGSAIDHAEKLAKNNTGKQMPLLVTKVLHVVERADPPIVSRRPRRSDFIK